MSERTSRRDFLKQAAAAGVGAACASLIPGAAGAQQPKSRVVVIKNTAALADGDSPGGSVNKAIVRNMVDQAVAKVAGVSTAKEGWASLFKPTDVVGIKVNCLFGKGVCTHPEVAHAVADALVDAGLKPSNVIIWDRSTGNLLTCGYKVNKDGDGVRVLANDGVWEDEPTRLGQFEGRLTKIVTRDITAIVNIPVMKHHGGSGISGALKNHYGTHDNPGRHHGNNCDPYLAELNAIPAIRDKTRLIVMDALRPMADGGPGLRREALWDYHSLIVSKDPVAVDAMAWKIIDERRQKTGIKTLAESGREPRWIKTAAGMGLGVDDPQKMEVINIG